MLGWKIFLHSIRLVFGNLLEALQIGLVPSVLLTVVIAFLVSASGFPYDQILNEAALEHALTSGQVNFGILFLIPCAWAVTVLWIFVAWHRFILLEEYPSGWIPKFHADRILAYLGRAILMFLIALVLALVLLLISALLGSLAILIMPVGMVALAVITYRLSIILPAAAIGENLKVGDAWTATSNGSIPILILVLVMGIAQFLLQLAFGVVLSLVPVLGIAVQVIVNLIISLVNVSVLTTLYGALCSETITGLVTVYR